MTACWLGLAVHAHTQARRVFTADQTAALTRGSNPREAGAPRCAAPRRAIRGFGADSQDEEASEEEEGAELTLGGA